MQSIKNTTVSIILLFLSYGVYQVITKPLPSENAPQEFQPLAISDPSEAGIPKDLLNDLQSESVQPVAAMANEESIPPQLLDLNAKNGSDDPRLVEQQSPASRTDFQPELPDVPDLSPSRSTASTDPEFAVSQVSSFENVRAERTIDDALESANFGTDQRSTNQFQTDSQIIPSTVMSPVAARPASATTDARMSEANTPELAKRLSWDEINSMVESSDFQSALQELSLAYRETTYEIGDEQQVLDWLDALAAKVIYSTEHHSQSAAYVVQPGDTIGSLARKWQVPAQLIYNVNIQQIPDPNNLESGVEIKRIQGPFDAEIDSQHQKMTLYLNGMYAGRFTITAGQSLQPGEFRIVDKSAQDHLDRPYWIALNNGGSIYASDTNPQDSNDVALNLREAEEIFSILSATSTVRILR